ncbi:MerR family transcriptional regulator, mercuric resistance operon regulatory protein [Marinospirillum celere]|uniref:Mercuric resistance operon regulatory protein n=1 Tax=Marinospirillum celere TaxID=1122252 RepID=A0A1I1DUY2_9GAMM|nr:Hg(II)-responsive transcriptional regulator [Marinospirillum celere]SFB78634.1 MerR family transcriptional regulator, mercuric resistance operon regulatory protein [Marinospirillum celere]
MSDRANSLTIGGLAKAAKVHIETIRYYQRRGLLQEPQRPPGGVRRYGDTDVRRLAFVKRAQQLGFSLDEVGDLLRLEDGASCQEARILAEHKLQDVREKIDGLVKIEMALGEMIDRCQEYQGRITCPLIVSLHEGFN